MAGLVLPASTKYLVDDVIGKHRADLLASLVGSCACILPGVVIAVFSIVDAYQTAVRLQGGETIGENEYTFAPLFKIVSFADKEATCKNA